MDGRTSTRSTPCAGVVRDRVEGWESIELRGWPATACRGEDRLTALYTVAAAAVGGIVTFMGLKAKLLVPKPLVKREYLPLCTWRVSIGTRGCSECRRRDEGGGWGGVRGWAPGVNWGRPSGLSSEVKHA